MDRNEQYGTGGWYARFVLAGPGPGARAAAASRADERGYDPARPEDPSAHGAILGQVDDVPVPRVGDEVVLRDPERTRAVFVVTKVRFHMIGVDGGLGIPHTPWAEVVVRPAPDSRTPA